jgi:hypothetical protein
MLRLSLAAALAGLLAIGAGAAAAADVLPVRRLHYWHAKRTPSRASQSKCSLSTILVTRPKRRLSAEARPPALCRTVSPGRGRGH